MPLHLALIAAPMVLLMTEQGMTEIGARQALAGQVITNPGDRARLAALLSVALKQIKDSGLQNKLAVNMAKVEFKR